MPKAGSSALQFCFQKNRETLRRNKIWYPDYASLGFSHHALFAQNTPLEPFQPLPGSEADAWRMLAEKTAEAGCAGALLSSEPAFPFVNECSLSLKKHARYWDHISIIAILRHQIDFMQAAFMEILRSEDARH